MAHIKTKLKPNSLIYTEDIKEILFYAFRVAKSNIFISTPWIKYYAFRALKNSIHSALKRNVNIYIKCGIGQDKDNELSIDERSQKIIDTLKEYENFHIFDKANDHSKILLFDMKDKSWLIVGSFNFLSFNPNNFKDYRNEVAALLDNKEMIEEYLAHINTYFKQDINLSLESNDENYMSDKDKVIISEITKAISQTRDTEEYSWKNVTEVKFSLRDNNLPLAQKIKKEKWAYLMHKYHKYFECKLGGKKGYTQLIRLRQT